MRPPALHYAPSRACRTHKVWPSSRVMHAPVVIAEASEVRYTSISSLWLSGVRIMAISRDVAVHDGLVGGSKTHSGQGRGHAWRAGDRPVVAGLQGLAHARAARLAGADLVEDAFLHGRPARPGGIEGDERERAVRVEVQHVADGHAVLLHPADEEDTRRHLLGRDVLGPLLSLLRAAERGPGHARLALVMRLELEPGLVTNHDGLADEAHGALLCRRSEARQAGAEEHEDCARLSHDGHLSLVGSPPLGSRPGYSAGTGLACRSPAGAAYSQRTARLSAAGNTDTCVSSWNTCAWSSSPWYSRFSRMSTSRATGMAIWCSSEPYDRNTRAGSASCASA